MIVMGDLKKPLPRETVPELLENLFPSYPHPISSYNVREALEVFGRSGSRSKALLWADIRKRLREHRKDYVGAMDKGLFIGTALSPESLAVRHWHTLLSLIGIYHFIVVPVRIAFIPWSSMLDTTALCSDLLADALTVMNIVILGSVAYKNSRAVWITDRYKILKKVHICYYAAAIPLDW
jgi:hypothetical protein